MVQFQHEALFSSSELQINRKFQPPPPPPGGDWCWLPSELSGLEATGSILVTEPTIRKEGGQPQASEYPLHNPLCLKPVGLGTWEGSTSPSL